MSGYTVPDPGLQAERTALSWVRTSASVGVVGLLLLRWLPAHGVVVVVPSLAAFSVAVWLRVVTGPNYRRGLRGITADVEARNRRRRRSDPAVRAAGLGDAAKPSLAQPGRVLFLFAGVLVLAGAGLWAMSTTV